jgi:hypothetical protein
LPLKVLLALNTQHFSTIFCRKFPLKYPDTRLPEFDLPGCKPTWFLKDLITVVISLIISTLL